MSPAFSKARGPVRAQARSLVSGESGAGCVSLAEPQWPRLRTRVTVRPAWAGFLGCSTTISVTQSPPCLAGSDLLFGPYVFVTEARQMPRKATGDFAFSFSWETDRQEDFSPPHGRRTHGHGHGQSAAPRVLGHCRRRRLSGSTGTGRREARLGRSQPCGWDITTCGFQKERARARAHAKPRRGPGEGALSGSFWGVTRAYLRDRLRR